MTFKQCWMIVCARIMKLMRGGKSTDVTFMIINKNFKQLLCFVLTEPTQTFCEYV